MQRIWRGCWLGAGNRVSLRIGVPDVPVSDAAPFEVIALKSRTAPKADAIAQVLAAYDWLKEAGAERFFWKYCSTFDSTPEGNIGPVAEALMERIGTGQTIYCPAFPENGRAVFMGNLFVGEEPLAESSMKDHPLTPMRDSNLMRLLAPQVNGRVALINRSHVAKGAEVLRKELDRLRRQTVLSHVVVDAVEDADLGVIAEAARHLPLLTGGSAIAMSLPDLYARDGLIDLDGTAFQPVIPAHKAVVLSGSCSAMTNAQVARLPRDRRAGLSRGSARVGRRRLPTNTRLVGQAGSRQGAADLRHGRAGQRQGGTGSSGRR